MSEHERAIALMEAHQEASTEAYFKARPQIDCIDRRRVYEYGFKEAWNAQQARIDALEKDAARLKHITHHHLRRYSDGDWTFIGKIPHTKGPDFWSDIDAAVAAKSYNAERNSAPTQE